MITPRSLGLAALVSFGFAGAARAQDGDYASKIANTVNACSIVCLDELNIEVFGSLIVPFERPSVEYCGVRASMTDAERAQEDRAALADVDKQALQNKFSPKEKQSLRMKATEKPRKCDMDFRRHCEETKTKFKLEDRKSAVDRTKKAIADAGEAGRTAALTKYLNAVLAKCTLDQ